MTCLRCANLFARRMVPCRFASETSLFRMKLIRFRRHRSQLEWSWTDVGAQMLFDFRTENGLWLTKCARASRQDIVMRCTMAVDFASVSSPLIVADDVDCAGLSFQQLSVQVGNVHIVRRFERADA